jgi:hypothetical protein
LLLQEPRKRPDSVEVVKKGLIGRNDFVGFQKLSDLKSEVVPEATIDDRVVKDPVRAVDVDD